MALDKGFRLRLHSVSIEFPLFAPRKSLRNFPRRAATESFLALQDIDLEIKNGDRLALTGPNGSGKTTLLRVMAGIFYPTRGIVEMNGQVASLIDNGFGLDLHQSGHDNCRTRALLMGVGQGQISTVTEEIKAFVDIGEFFNQPVRTYSQGMIARLAFALSTQWPREILLIDEGVGAFDAAFQSKAQARLEEYANEASCLVLATHNDTLISHLTTKTLTMTEGRLA